MRIRFIESVDKIGGWKWRSQSKTMELDAQSGRFDAVASHLPGKLRKHPDDPFQFATRVPQGVSESRSGQGQAVVAGPCSIFRKNAFAWTGSVRPGWYAGGVARENGDNVRSCSDA